jgi:hypothetical protein
MPLPFLLTWAGIPSVPFSGNGRKVGHACWRSLPMKDPKTSSAWSLERHGKPLYRKGDNHFRSSWGSVNNMMYVVGATKAEALAGIRKPDPGTFLIGSRV